LPLLLLRLAAAVVAPCCALMWRAQGRRVGSGSFGEVFRGELDDPAGGDEPIDVVLKKRKLSLNAQRVRDAACACWTLRAHAGRCLRLFTRQR
jgi:hypothetical protein